MGRLIKDATFVAAKYFAAAAASAVYTDAFDLGAGAFKPEEFELEIVVPAMPNNTDSTKTALITVQDSADNITFTNLAPLVQVQIAGVASTGSSAVTSRIRLPSGVRQYVRVSLAIPSGGGDNTAVAVTASLLF